MYLYERTSTPVLRDMGCTVPVLRDMGCIPVSLLYCTVTVLRDIGCIRTCVVVLPYSGTLDVSQGDLIILQYQPSTIRENIF